MIDFGDIWEAFQVLAKSGGLGVIHAEDNDIVITYCDRDQRAC
jgi:dihydropyrimidinase